MTDFTITKTVPMVLSPQQRDLLREYLMGVLDGVTDEDKRAWRRFWNRLNKLEVGEIVDFEAIFPRNGKFHRKFFALLNFAFDSWDPKRQRKSYKGVPVQKNFERFRKDIIIQAGFYEQTFNLDGAMKLEAKSISFAAMDDEEFEGVYSAVATVILQKVLVTYKGRAQLDEVMNQLIGFL